MKRKVQVYDWDEDGTKLLKASRFKLLDTTLRDGLQTPGIRQPTLEDKLKIVDFSAHLGIEAMDVCLPSDPNTTYYKEGVEIAKYIKKKYPKIEIVVLARTIQKDIDATLQFAKDSKSKLSVILFRGTSDLRLLAEDWHQGEIVLDMKRFAKKLVKNKHKVICATEDTTRTRPEFLKKVFKAGKEGGATEFCIADTVGYSSPKGIKNQIDWLKKEVLEESDLIHFHGHNDTGMEIANSLSAIELGAGIIHVTWLGLGERTGNTSLETMLANLERRGINKYKTSKLVEGSNFVANAFGFPIPKNYPLVGADVFSTESGIHASGIEKARKKGLDVAGRVYSANDPASFGREITINIGPLGGAGSVRWVLEKMGIEITPQITQELLRLARIKNQALTEEEISAVVREMNGSH